jgi:glycerol-3-phosphate dehydrogenase subunit B
MTDLIIVGAGLAGMMAGYAAARRGLSSKIIAKGLGALHWSAGTIDVLGYYPSEQDPVEQPVEHTQMIVQENSNHPYAFVDGKLADRLNEFLALTQEIGLPYLGARDQTNWWLPSPVGAVRRTFLAPQAQASGDLHSPEPMLIVGFRGMRDFFSELIAENLRKQGYPARAAFLPLDLVTERRDVNPVQIAYALDDPERQTHLAVQLKEIVRPGERIGLPAILGMSRHLEVVEQLESRIGARVFEIPTLPPSVPGIRLDAALRKHLEKLGVRIELNMEVSGFQVEGDRVSAIETRTSGRPLVHRAKTFLLATGGILGGGIETDHTGKSRDTVLNLPLTIPSERHKWFRANFLDPAGHPVFRGGVAVNWQWQPIDAAGARVFANVWAAGGILAHADPILERSLEGIAITTGIAAANACTLDSTV